MFCGWSITERRKEKVRRTRIMTVAGAVVFYTVYSLQFTVYHTVNHKRYITLFIPVPYCQYYCTFTHTYSYYIVVNTHYSCCCLFFEFPVFPLTSHTHLLTLFSSPVFLTLSQAYIILLLSSRFSFAFLQHCFPLSSFFFLSSDFPSHPTTAQSKPVQATSSLRFVARDGGP